MCRDFGGGLAQFVAVFGPQVVLQVLFAELGEVFVGVAAEDCERHCGGWFGGGVGVFDMCIFWFFGSVDGNVQLVLMMMVLFISMGGGCRSG